jgi:hypothetical protein
MAVYTEYSQVWLEDPDSIKIILVVAQVYNVQTALTETLRWGNAPYVTSDGLLTFSAIIRRDVRLSETLTLEGTGAMTFGDLELDNSNGELDLYLDKTKYIWSSRSLKIYHGDAQWNCSSTDIFATTPTPRFKLIFDGLTHDVDSRARNTLNLKIRDKLEQLNTPVTENKLGTTGTWNGGQQNQDAIKPLVFGEVFNMTPLLIDPSTLKYQFNDGPAEAVLEIRDNGNPIYNTTKPNGATVDLTTGTFTLPYQALGTITCSVQGIKTPVRILSANSTITSTPAYTADVAALIATVVTQYGQGAVSTSTPPRPSARFGLADIDFVNLYDFSFLSPVGVGAVVADTQNVLVLCRALAQSVGAQIFINRIGQLQLLRYGTYYTAGATVTAIGETDIIYNSLSISARLEAQASVKLGYAKNYTVQKGLLTSIPQNHKDSFAEEWLTVTNTDAAVAAQYQLSLEASQINTQMINTTDASTECTRRLTFNKTPHTVYKFTGTSKLLGLQLGQKVTLTHSRFNLYNSGTGVDAQVVSLSPNWTRGVVEVEVLI